MDPARPTPRARFIPPPERGGSDPCFMAERSADPNSPAPAKERPKRGAAPAGRLNSLGFSRADLDRFLDELETLAHPPRLTASSGTKAPAQPAPAPKGGAAARRYVRRTLRLACVPLRMHRQGGDGPAFPVACRNISCSGISVLHSAYIHPGTRCTAFLPNATGSGAVAARGEVVRCRHIRGMAHEVGIRFDEPLDLRQVMRTDCLGDWFSLERVDPTELSGPVLCVAASEADRQLLRSCLTETNLAVVVAETAELGLAKAVAGTGVTPFAALICAHDPPGLDAAQLIEQLRGRGCRTPAVILLTERTADLRARIGPISDVAAVSKPLDAQMLLRALAEFLLLNRASRAA
jgi:CheY-like chemotaxis protein